MIEVVSAVIVRHARLLLMQRRPDQTFPLTWVTPGGKVEGNESHHQALARELVEEISVAPVSMAQTEVWCGHPTPENQECFVVIYWTDIGQGDPIPRERNGIGWFSADEVEHLSLGPADSAARRQLCELLRRAEWDSQRNV